MLVEGPLNNLRESLIQFSKPKKLVNPSNPVPASCLLVSVAPCACCCLCLLLLVSVAACVCCCLCLLLLVSVATFVLFFVDIFSVNNTVCYLYYLLLSLFVVIIIIRS